MSYNPFISVVIPCYNHGQYLLETIESLNNISYENKEIIIVNDGSNEEYTLNVIKSLEDQHYIVINQENKGLGAARNSGIKNAKGDYILPLDADNVIRQAYFTHGVLAFENDPSISVVYGDVRYMNTGEILPNKDLDLNLLIYENQIDACTLIKKSVFDDCKYIEDPPLMGCEDWMLWLNLIEKGCKFKYINETAFDYRVSDTSMIRVKKPKGKVINLFELLQKFQVRAADAAFKRKELSAQEHKLLITKVALRLSYYKMNGGNIAQAYKTILKILKAGPMRLEALKIATSTFLKRIVSKTTD